MRFFFIVFIFLFGGCATKHYMHVQSRVIVLKSSVIRFADTGFVKESEKEVALEIFNASIPILKLSIQSGKICMNSICMEESTFYQNNFKRSYPEGLLESVVLGKPLMEGKSIIFNQSGFEQKIGSINYRVDDRQIVFRDEEIMIKLRSIE